MVIGCYINTELYVISDNYNIWLHLMYELTKTDTKHINSTIQMKLHRSEFSQVGLLSAFDRKI